MAHRWPADTDFAPWELDVIDRDCACCGRMMHICDYRYLRLFTLDGPVQLACKLNRCPDPLCPGHMKTKSPEIEARIALPGWIIGWDVLCWIGHRRFARHWSIPQIRQELVDSYAIALSENSVANYVRRYQTMLAARQQDLDTLRTHYRGFEQIVLSIDGLQPEKGHETLYVVRELLGKRVWFAEALISASAEEVRRLIALAKRWAKALGKSVALWISDKQDAFVSGIKAEFPGVPHRYCGNHFLRDLAKPVLEADSHAKVQMRKKVRGLRGIERSVLDYRRVATSEVVETGPSSCANRGNKPDVGSGVVLAYCAMVRGILNDDQGGPLHPPGLRMGEALGEVRASLDRNLSVKKGGSPKHN